MTLLFCLWNGDLDMMEVNKSLEALELKSVPEVSGEDKIPEPPSPRKTRWRNARRSSGNFGLISGGHTSKPIINIPEEIIDISQTDIEKIYLSKEVKSRPSTLQTIFEEPKLVKKDIQFMSNRKFRRVVDFGENEIQQRRLSRAKKRLMKAKKVTAPTRKANTTKKITLKTLMNRLKALDDDERVTDAGLLL